MTEMEVLKTMTKFNIKERLFNYNVEYYFCIERVYESMHI